MTVKDVRRRIEQIAARQSRRALRGPARAYRCSTCRAAGHNAATCPLRLSVWHNGHERWVARSVEDARAAERDHHDALVDEDLREGLALTPAEHWSEVRGPITLSVCGRRETHDARAWVLANGRGLLAHDDDLLAHGRRSPSGEIARDPLVSADAGDPNPRGRPA